MKHYFEINTQQWEVVKQLSERQGVSLQAVFLSVFLEALHMFRDITDSEFLIDIKTDTILKKVEINEAVVSLHTWTETCSNIQELIGDKPCQASTASSYLFEWNLAETAFVTESTYNCIFSYNEKGGAIAFSEKAQEFPNADNIIAAIQKNLQWITEGNWEEKNIDYLPPSQRKLRNQVNDTFVDIPEKLLHEDFFVQAFENPDKIALYWVEGQSEKTLTYGALAKKSLQLAAYLIHAGVQPNEIVAITLPKGVEQIISVLGILAAGGTYLPISIDQPKERQQVIRTIAGVKYTIVAPTDQENSKNHHFISIDQIAATAPLANPVKNNPDASAYIIFTSGSTGEPKGVEVAHKAAYNTICDLNNKYNIASTDKILAISALDFDLSVYDIFGSLAKGAGIVLIQESQRKEAAVWCQLVQKYQITVWNTVPALLDMLLLGADQDVNLGSLRLVFVSGDWVGLDLNDRLKSKTPHCQFIAMGGATEAAIWSNYFEVEEVKPDWNAIPYGMPLANQKYRVVNIWGADCPDGVSGELWIGGKGVAKGYLKRLALTQKSFVTVCNEIWYRTGDVGRYWADGNIEFLGRKDQQVKVRGYRIELGEIEAALKKHDGVFQSIATVVKSANSQHLVAGVVGEKRKTDNISISQDLQQDRQNIDLLQDKVVINFLIHLLGFDKMKANDVWNPSDIQNSTNEMLSVVRMWANWLVTKNVLTKAATGYTITSEIEGYKEINFEHEAVHQEVEKLQFVHNRLLNSIEVYNAVLRGAVPEVTLLNLEGLTPEYLATLDAGTTTGIERLAEKINALVKNTDAVVNVGILGGRTGILAAQLLTQVAIKNVSFTVFDTAQGLLEVANEKLKKTGHIVTCVRADETAVPESYKYHFDIVLGINVFHRYKKVHEGLDTAFLMLKNDGLFMALEHFALAPIALITSAVLDKAFVDFDAERKEKASPMLTGVQWSTRMTQSGFTSSSFNEITGTYTNYLEAKTPSERRLLLAEEIKESIALHLPSHMLPEKIAVLPFIPLSANGKVDKKTVATQFTFLRNETVEAPREGMEMAIATIWKSLLQIEEIGRNQVFFQIGGDSLSATKFLSMIKERYAVALSLTEIFEAPLHEIALQLENSISEQALELESMEEGEI